MANVGDDGVIYFKYADPGENCYLDFPCTDVCRPAEKFDNYTSLPPSYRASGTPFALPPSPPASDSDNNSQTDAPHYWHDGLHESAAAVYPDAEPAQARTHIPSLRTPSVGNTTMSARSNAENKKQRYWYDQNYLHPDLMKTPTAEKTDPIDSPMLLQVNIPSFRIGVPRFSHRGTLFFDSYSMRSDAETNRGSNLSKLDLDNVFPAPPGANSTSPYLDAAKLAYAHPFGPPRPVNSIDPSIFDALAYDSNNARYISYMPDGQIFAATPARLIAHVTHPDFLDYDLLSDFFMTYRAFLSSHDLLRYIMSRLRWAVFRKQEIGRVVRVRTFVAIRHWILNYFLDDFEPDYELRVLFCDLVNAISRDLAARRDWGGGDLQVVAELKKCWRRTCDIVWGTSTGLIPHLPTDGITPGGRDEDGNAIVRLKAARASLEASSAAQDFFSRPVFPTRQASVAFRAPIDLTSIVISPSSPWLYRSDSYDVTSCSIPMWRTLGRALPSHRPRSLMPLEDNAKETADISRLPSKLHRHKKSKSSKGSNDSAGTYDRNEVVFMDPKNDLGPFKCGQLIRGMLLAPPLPQITKQVAVYSTDSLNDDQEEKEGAISQVVDHVRRKLSTRDGSPSKKRGLSGSSHSYKAHRKDGSADTQARIMLVTRSDFLAARAADSYEKLIRDDQTVRRQGETDRSRPQTRHGQKPSDGSDVDKDLPPRPFLRARQNSHVTTSSRSIMIINDTRNNDPVVNIDVHDMVTPVEKFSNSPPRKFNMPFSQDMSGGRGLAQAYPPIPLINPHLGHLQQGTASNLKVPNSGARQESKVSSFAPSDTASQGLGVFMPDNRTSNAVESIQSGARRQSSLVEPLLLVPTNQGKQLRRRPGGDLRAADNIDELRSRPRRNSTGSVVEQVSRTTSASLSAEIADAVFASKMAHARVISNRLRAHMTASTKKGSIQLLSTHSSHPNFRASFQAEVNKLASMTGADVDDGGVDSTLAKLEGRIASPTSPEPAFKQASASMGQSTTIVPENNSASRSQDNAAPASRAESSHNVANVIIEPPPPQFSPDEYVIRGDAGPPSDVGSLAGRWSYILAPAERSSAAVSKKNWPLMGSVKDPRSPLPRPGSQKSSDENSSFLDDALSSDDEDEPRTPGAQAPMTFPHSHGSEEQSFFLDGDDDDRDATPVRGVYDPPLSPPPSTPLPALPFSQAPVYDPVPPKAAQRMRTPGPVTKDGSAEYISNEQPVLGLTQRATSRGMAAQNDSYFPRSTPGTIYRTLHPPHNPYILAFNSEVLATQFTVIERDALEEIDWKELVELRWSKTPTTVLNWADYMRVPGQTGVDIVIARFNLVVKWAVSEILLTNDIHERASTIIKYIHIAGYAKRLRNFATAYQFTVALLSTAVSRLKRTWELVPAAEKETLKALEIMVQPMRNFGILRQEMEGSLLAPGFSASVTIDNLRENDARPTTAESSVYATLKPGACIPFIGIYTHDLAYIAQQPAFVDPAGNPVAAPAPGVMPPPNAMINFERFRLAAAAVKNMLRLLEASSKYTIRPNRELVSRCLWLAALDDNDIEARSRALE